MRQRLALEPVSESGLLDTVLEALNGSAASWHESKLFVEQLIAICHDTLHLLAGVVLWLLLAVVMRRSVADWQPLAATAAVAILNEAVDLWFDIWPSAGRQTGEGARDLIVTLAVPALLFVVIRLKPSLFQTR
jgi:hypothetical protein